MTPVAAKQERSAVFVSNLFPSHHEPVRGIFNLRQLSGLRARGWDFAVVAPVFSFPFHRTRFGPAAREVAGEEEVEGLPTLHPRALYLPLSRGALNARLYEWSIRGAVERACRMLQPSFLWSAFAFPDGVAVGRIARRSGLPHVASVLGSDVNLGLELGRRRQVLLKELGAARVVLTKSQALRELLIAHGLPASRIACVYNGVDHATFRFRARAEACRELGVDGARKRILFVGDLVPVKGLPVLLKAFARLADPRHGDLEVALVGDGHLHDKLAAAARHLGIGDKVVFLGRRPPSEVSLWLNASDVMCLPSLREGLPNVVLEALSSGCPVVASRVGGVPEVHPGDAAGALVEAGQPEALAQALGETLRRSWDREAIAASMDGWSWAASTQQVEDVFVSAGLIGGG